MSVTSFHNGRVTLHAGDCLDVLDALSENSVDSCVCDPPYHLASIVKRFGAEGAAPALDGKTGAFRRASAGFMGKQWDGGDIAFRPETWAKVLRVLKPGAYIVAFSSSRTFGRMSVALEDAGFITHPMIGWIFAQGFPKATRIRAKGYDGFRYGGQALKPALEPIYVGQKPFSEANGTANILRWGTGAINIDGCRVGTSKDVPSSPAKDRIGQIAKGDERGRTADTSGFDPNIGRWPANLVLSDDAEVLDAFPSAPGQQRSVGPHHGAKNSVNVFGDYGAREQTDPRGDSGSAARFFYQHKKDCVCDLCGMRWNSKSASISACDASPAEQSSTTKASGDGASAHCDAAAPQQLESEAKQHRPNCSAVNAESGSLAYHLPSDNFVQSSAIDLEASKIAQNVKSAATLCASCETAIARSLAATRLGLDPASLQCLDFITEPLRLTLSHCLALYVAGRENTDTITTTAGLKTLLGSVCHAIESTTSSAKSGARGSSRPDLKQFHFSSKADADDRLNSKHPTVKPLDLMRYLVRLVTPPRGLVLDPFAGTGTTGHAALIEGMRAVLIEREAEYQADIARRMDLVFAGQDERARKLAKAAPHDTMPLFGGAA